jgi:sugar (pentulose or hexulose) kinase
VRDSPANLPPAYRRFSSCWMTGMTPLARPGKYLYESTGIRRGMWTVSWYRTVLEGSHGQEPPAGAARLEDILNAEAGELAPGSNGLLTLPDWLAPGHAGWRRGALLGFDGSQGRAHIYRSILEASP